MNIFLAIVKIAAILGVLFIASELYARLRKRMNRPKIGVELLTSLLYRGDYVSIEGNILKFSHIAQSNETIDHLSFPSEKIRQWEVNLHSRIIKGWVIYFYILQQ